MRLWGRAAVAARDEAARRAIFRGVVVSEWFCVLAPGKSDKGKDGVVEVL
jgi:hypothetical protein